MIGTPISSAGRNGLAWLPMKGFADSATATSGSCSATSNM